MPTPTSNDLDTWITTYSIPESPQSTVRVDVRLFVTDFSDGYSQRIPDGVSNVRRNYTFVTRLLDTTAANAMRDFLVFYSQGEQIVKDTSPTDSVERNWWIHDWSEKLEGPLHHSFTALLVEDR